MSYSLGHQPDTAPAYCALCDAPCQTGPLCGACLDHDDQGDEVERCECELDWRCGLHAGLHTPAELIADDFARRELPA